MRFSLVAAIGVSVLLCCTREIYGQTFSTITFPEGIDGANPIISAVENTENVTFFCEVTRISDGVQRQTAWTLIKDEVQTILLFTPEGLGQTGFENYVVSQETLRSNITILVFDETFDNNQIGCGSGSEIVSRFDLRIIKPPVLFQNSTPIGIIEGSLFSIYMELTEGFPIVPDDYEWSFDGTPISEGGSNPNISIYPVIILPNVNRTDSGNYSITVYNEGGTSTGFFILYVVYPAEGVPQTGPFYVVTGDDITITAYTNIDGNPNPTSIWTKDNVQVTDGGRFNTSVPGQLTITTVMSSDAGNYTNTLTNGVLISINNTIELIVSVPPSMPRSVTVVGDPEPESVVLSWLNPNTIGSPVFSLFNVSIYTTTEGISNITRQVTPNNTIDTDYNNTVTINGLKPNIQYTVTIIAISNVEQLGILTSAPSDEVVFNTSSGAPDFLSTVLTNVNGNLSVTWYFRHTGGVGLATVTVNCEREDEGEDDDDSSGDNLLSIIEYCTSMSDCDGRNVSLGPIIAGVNYSCLVTADNNIGEDEMRTNYLIADTGIPSLPVVTNVTGGSGVATCAIRIYVQVSYSGVINPADFNFTISIYNENDQLFDNQTINPDSQYFTGSLMNGVITVNLEEGMYSFRVQSSNPYGMSEVTELTDEAMCIVVSTPTTSITTTTTISTGPSPTTTFISTIVDTFTTSTVTPTSTGEPSGTSGISGGAIAGIVIGIIILVAIIAIVVLIVFYIVYKGKGGSYEVEGGGGGGGKKGVKVEELDIDIGTELQESTPLRDPTKEPTEKTELHYADLAQFHQPKSTPKQQQPPTKPTPIEEVQYAQIRPQDISQTSGGDEDMPPTSSDIL